MLEEERLASLATKTGAKHGDFKKFTHPWIQVEEMSGMYKPIVAREYPNGTWPRIYFEGHSSRTGMLFLEWTFSFLFY